MGKGQINLTNEEQRHYGYLKEYLDLSTHFLEYGFDSVSITYCHQDLSKSIYDDQTSAHFNINQSNNNEIYFDKYHLTPVFTGNSITSSVIYDIQQHGLSSDMGTSMTIFTVERPLEHDVIIYYTPVSDVILFEVTNVTEPSVLKQGELNLWNLNIRKLNVSKNSFDEQYRFKNDYYYMQELNKYIDYDKYIEFQSKEDIEIIVNQSYDPYETKYDMTDNDNRALLFVHDKAISTVLKVIDKNKITPGEIDPDTLDDNVLRLYNLYL